MTKRRSPALPALTVASLAAVVAGITWLSGSPFDSHAETGEPSSPVQQLTTQADGSAIDELLGAGLADTEHDVTTINADATLQLLATIPAVDEAQSALPYSRDAYGQRWADIDRNGCDTRNDILRRDLVDVGLKPGTNDCVVLTGTLHDAYTGQDITFQRGQGTSELVQIDHLWSLSGSWDAGADLWTADKREQFANDPANLEAVDGPSNSAKGDSGPSQWLPANADYLCTYAARLTFVASKYQLPLFAEDRLSITHILERCGS